MNGTCRDSELGTARQLNRTENAHLNGVVLKKQALVLRLCVASWHKLSGFELVGDVVPASCEEYSSPVRNERSRSARPPRCHGPLRAAVGEPSRELSFGSAVRQSSGIVARKTSPGRTRRFVEGWIFEENQSTGSSRHFVQVRTRSIVRLLDKGEMTLWCIRMMLTKMAWVNNRRPFIPR